MSLLADAKDGRVQKLNPEQTVAAGPRLLSLHQAAAYLGLSYWTVRDWILAGHLSTVNLPPLRPKEGDRARASLRRVLVDRVDLDAFIEARKGAAHQ